MNEFEELGIKHDWYSKKRRKEVVRVGRYQVVKEHREWCLYNSKGEALESSVDKKYIIGVAKALSVK